MPEAAAGYIMAGTRGGRSEVPVLRLSMTEVERRRQSSSFGRGPTLSPSSAVRPCDSCGQRKVTVEHEGRWLCLACLQREEDGAPAAVAPPAQTGMIEYAMDSTPTAVAPSPLAGFTNYPIGDTTMVAAPPPETGFVEHPTGGVPAAAAPPPEPAFTEDATRVAPAAVAPPPEIGFAELPTVVADTRQDLRQIRRPRRRRRGHRRQKWLILGAIVLSVGGALLAIVITQGTSGLIRFFTVPSLEAKSGRKYTPTSGAKRYIEKLSEGGSKK